MNSYNATGNITANAELRYLPNSTAVAQFNIAINSGYGESQTTTFFRCSLFGKRAETLVPMLLKGTKIGITGEVSNRKYVDKQGVEKYSLEVRVNDVTLLGGKGEGKPDSQPEAANPFRANDENAQGSNSFDDGIPF